MYHRQRQLASEFHQLCIGSQPLYAEMWPIELCPDSLKSEKISTDVLARYDGLLAPPVWEGYFHVHNAIHR